MVDRSQRWSCTVATGTGSFLAAFRNSYEALVSGATGMIPESDLTPASGVPKLADVATGAKPMPFSASRALLTSSESTARPTLLRWALKSS